MNHKIVTITLNPAIDRVLYTDRPGAVLSAGGKGVNVARAARALRAPVRALVVAGGVTGDVFKQLLRKERLPCAFVAVEGRTRINTTAVCSDGRVSRTLEAGSVLGRAQRAQVVAGCADESERAAVIVFSGSVPPGFPAREFASLVRSARQAGRVVAVDTSAAALVAALRSGVDIIKPNRAEAEAVLGFRLSSRARITKALHTFLGYGIKKVLISLGEDGLAASDGREDVRASMPPIQGGHTVGCGDAALAGFLVAQLSGKDLKASVRFAAACGGANVLAGVPGGISRVDVIRMQRNVRIDKE